MKKIVSFILTLISFCVLFSACEIPKEQPPVEIDEPVSNIIEIAPGVTAEILADDTLELLSRDGREAQTSSEIQIYNEYLYYIGYSNSMYHFYRENLSSGEEEYFFSTDQSKALMGLVVIDETEVYFVISESYFGRLYSYSLITKELVSMGDKYDLAKYDIFYAMCVNNQIFFYGERVDDGSAYEICKINREKATVETLQSGSAAKLDYFASGSNLFIRNKDILYLVNEKCEATPILQLAGLNFSFLWPFSCGFNGDSLYFTLIVQDQKDNLVAKLNLLNRESDILFAYTDSENRVKWKSDGFLYENKIPEPFGDSFVYDSIQVDYYDYSGNKILSFPAFEMEFPLFEVPYVFYNDSIYYIRSESGRLTLETLEAA